MLPRGGDKVLRFERGCDAAHLPGPVGIDPGRRQKLGPLLILPTDSAKVWW